MKHTLLYIATLFLLTACQQEELPQGAQALGYLSLSAVEVEAGDVQLISTRAEDTDDLIVALTPKDGSGEVTKCECSEMISCQPGTYKLEIYTENYETANDNAPKYHYVHNEDVVITEGNETKVGSISVPMINFGVRLELPEEFTTWFKDNYTFTVNGENLKDGETVYFDYSSDAKIEYTLTATNKDDEPFSEKGSNIDDCWEGKTIASGTIYVITYELATRSLKIS